MKALVVVVRGLHLGHVGCYGNAWIDTPTLDRLAAEGVVFDQHYADNPDAGAARRAWRSGRYQLPSPDGATAAGGDDLVALLRGAGVATVLIDDAGRPVPPAFAAGWDEVIWGAAADALGRLAGSDRRLLWLELPGLLPPWDVPEAYLDPYLREPEGEDEDEAEEEPTDDPVPALTPWSGPVPDSIGADDDETFLRLQRTYAAAVTCLDEELGSALDGLPDDVLLAVTSDHGLPLGEHGAVGPGRPWPHDELIHVPLILRFPGGAGAGRRVSALTQSVDLMPTLLDAFGLPPPTGHGHSLLPLARGAADAVRAYACCGCRSGDEVEWALRTPEWGLVLPAGPPRAPQLFVKPDDRWEVNDVRQHHLELAEHMEEVLREFAAAANRPGQLRGPELRDVESEPNETTAGPGAGSGTEGGAT